MNWLNKLIKIKIKKIKLNVRILIISHLKLNIMKIGREIKFIIIKKKYNLFLFKKMLF